MKGAPEVTLELKAAANTANTETILSPALRQALDEGGGALVDPPRLLGNSEIANIRARALTDIDALGHPYHNGRHVQSVLKQTKELAKAASVGSIETQLLELAALFHDYGHSGNTYRQLVPGAS